MKRLLYNLICLMLGVTLSGCIEEFEADIPEEDSNLLVVEGPARRRGYDMLWENEYVHPVAYTTSQFFLYTSDGCWSKGICTRE